MAVAEQPFPSRVQEFAERAVDYVRTAVGLTLEYDSDTLPLLDHYLRNVPQGQASTVELVALTSGAYFGEVVRRRLGGRWDITADDATEWRVFLPTGLNFAPAGFAAAAIMQADLDDLDSELDAPARMRPYIAQALARMGEVSVDDYYSLCGRLDTLEHVHEVLVAVAAKLVGDETEPPDGVEPVEAAAVLDDLDTDPTADPDDVLDDVDPDDPDDPDDAAPEPAPLEDSGPIRVN